MIRPDQNIQVYLCREPVDMRKSIDGLSLLVESELELNPFDSALFVFCNRQRDKIKILFLERNGFVVWYKRLESERFKWPEKLATAASLSGISIKGLSNQVKPSSDDDPSTDKSPTGAVR